MNKVQESRRMWKFIIFGFLTCGIYSIYYMWGVCKDLNIICRHTEKSADNDSPNYIFVVLLSVVTFGIYEIYWWYKQGNRLQKSGKKYKVEIKESGISYLMWKFLPIILSVIGVVFLLLGSSISLVIYMVAYFFVLCGNYIAIYLFVKNLNKVAPIYNRLVSGDDDQDTIVDANTDDTWDKEENGMIYGKKGIYKDSEIEIYDQEEIIIGRDRNQCNLILTNADISRKHCGISYRMEFRNYIVTDYSSTGLYYADGTPFPKKPVVCEKGTILKLADGENEFLLR
ncbi:DUF4234 domain-containing protein [Anaerostipes sp. 992a]|uniref:DUF4234 domain-containing protein n=1 Tax=Anaerostipes sp. 992a TaxID=1261637 RepID=UPI000952F4B5|nr:DUF4234 domain-containing protein [Anaerostipes sp. 992a]